MVETQFAGTEYVDTTAESGKRYTYVVYPFAGSVPGEPSTTVKVALVGGKNSAQITATTSDGKAIISWNKVAGATKYRVRRNDGKKWDTMYTTSAANGSWTDSTLTKNVTYTYVVYAMVNDVYVASSTITVRV